MVACPVTQREVGSLLARYAGMQFGNETVQSLGKIGLEADQKGSSCWLALRHLFSRSCLPRRSFHLWLTPPPAFRSSVSTVTAIPPRQSKQFRIRRRPAGATHIGDIRRENPGMKKPREGPRLTLIVRGASAIYRP